MQHRFIIFLTSIVLWNCSPKEQVEDNLFYQLQSAIESQDEKLVDVLWDSLQQENQPYIWSDSVAFIYRGEASSVNWNGDFNGWGGDASFYNKGSRIGESNFWVLKTKFPEDARFDYKIVVDGKWMLDPANKAIQMAGVGGLSPNSEIRMPKSIPSKWTKDTAKSKGKLTDWITHSSDNLGYDINYKVYTPHNYEQLDSLPVIYSTDGNEYTHPQLGAMIEILDNLIEQEQIKPVLAVFIDPREPDNPQNNRRMEELNLNEKFKDFITSELVPKIDSSYKTANNRANRVIMGTSMGGLNASYIGAKSADMFGKVLIQSPAYRYNPTIYDVVNESDQWPLKVSISTGVFNDTQAAALKMKAIYESKLDAIQYIEVNEGHSWGNWRNTLDDQLIYLLGN
ncbi:MAG: alpha/beta hydrolase-fold protein [Fulvivirga sp.]|uniref:alpha/beta hydrolase-fold protein n=1 Tax=Fulvivirga sp. TaxID=1931237 RepID=UPI0032F06AE0